MQRSGTRARSLHKHRGLLAQNFPSGFEIQAPPLERIAIKTAGRIFVVRVHEIDWIEADQGCVSLHAGGKAWLLRESICFLETRLKSQGFVRIHRSTLLNIDRVRELHPLAKRFKVIHLGWHRTQTESSLSRLVAAARRIRPMKCHLVLLSSYQTASMLLPSGSRTKAA
jgi:DNA-binding LytR/AlgR family response regulator